MPSQILESIVRTKRGRRRTKPLIQCSVCGEFNAVAYYTRSRGKLYMHYKHPDKVINVKYHKLKNGKKVRRLIFKNCYVGEVSEGLPLANERANTIVAPQSEPANEAKAKEKQHQRQHKTKTTKTKLQKSMLTLLDFMRSELKRKDQDSLRLKNEIEEMEHPDLIKTKGLFKWVKYTRN